MDGVITQSDIELLISENVLAAEQLRRIVAERSRDELQAKLDALNAGSNGLGVEVDAVVETA